MTPPVRPLSLGFQVVSVRGSNIEPLGWQSSRSPQHGHGDAPSEPLIAITPAVAEAIRRALKSKAAVRLVVADPSPTAAGATIALEIIPLTGAGELALLVVGGRGERAERIDPLTRVADRSHLFESLQSWAATAESEPFAILFLDLDDFKQVNDQFGHVAGDRVLAELAARWQGAVREGDLVSRFGGDEFVVLARKMPTHEAARRLAGRIAELTPAPIRVADTTITVSVTIGIAIGRSPNEDPVALVAAADADMYCHKRARPPV